MSIGSLNLAVTSSRGSGPIPAAVGCRRLLHLLLVVLCIEHANAQSNGTGAPAQTNKPATKAAAKPIETPASPSLQDRLSLVRSFDDLKLLAKDWAAAPYQPTSQLPADLAALNYPQYISLQFRRERATWWGQKLPYLIETFHRGFVQNNRVELFTLNSTSGSEPTSQRVSFDPQDFQIRTGTGSDGLTDSQRLNLTPAGHAGIRFVGRFSPDGDWDEMLTFLGSSYFRGRSGFTLYGSSARGLAINIGMNEPEEFPKFIAFWVERPDRDDAKLHLFALLDSPTVSGAYRFEFTPGQAVSSQHVDAELYFRQVPQKLAVAPLTSMWMWGDGLKGPPKDLRPSVHDSDGLLVQTGYDDWTWRPYARQAYPSVAQVPAKQVLGFGVIQRNRDLLHYEDHNAQYHNRPSLWVSFDEPQTKGHIELLELVGAHEGVDNIGAYWVPNEKPQVGQPYRFAYQLQYLPGDPQAHHTRSRAIGFKVKRAAKTIQMEIHYTGHMLKPLKETEYPEADIKTIRGRVTEHSLKRIERGDWVLSATFEPEEDAPMEIAIDLKRNGVTLAEKFTYLLPPKEPQFIYPAVYTREE